MNIFSGLEQFGIKAEEGTSIFEEEKKAPAAAKEGEGETPAAKAEDTHSESEFLLVKSVRCPVCDRVFRTLVTKSGRVKRLEADKDLRPRFQYIDTLKYNVYCCPSCGYTSLNTSGFFEGISQTQVKLIQEKICRTFDPDSVSEAFQEGVDHWNYDMAIALHKLSLYNAIVKNAKISEKAYNCLMLSWLIRGQVETLPQTNEEEKKKVADLKAEEQEFYKQAYEGFTKAVSTENFPMCGMDQTTMDYLLAAMAYQMGDIPVASKLLSSILTNRAVSQGVKNKALLLRDEILESVKKGAK